MSDGVVYSDTGIFIAWHRWDGSVDNAWFYGPIDAVRWLKLYAGPLGLIHNIIVLRAG